MSRGVSRRALLGTGGAGSLLLLAAYGAGAGKAQELDGELIALCSEAVRLDADYCSLCWATDRVLPIWGTPEQAAALVEFERVSDRQDEVFALIAELPARTPEGLQAKARAVQAFYGADGPDGGSVAGPALWSLLCEMAGRIEA